PLPPATSTLSLHDALPILLHASARRRILGTSMKRLVTILAATISFSVHAAKPPAQWQIADKDLADYFARDTRSLSEKCLSNIQRDRKSTRLNSSHRTISYA